MWDVDNFSVLTENVETKDFSKWQAIKRIYLSELKINIDVWNIMLYTLNVSLGKKINMILDSIIFWRKGGIACFILH